MSNIGFKHGSEKEHGVRPRFLSSLSCVLSCRTLSGLISTPLHFSSHLFSCLKLISSSLVLSRLVSPCLAVLVLSRLVSSRLTALSCLVSSPMFHFVSARLLSFLVCSSLSCVVMSSRVLSRLVSHCLVSSLMTTGTIIWLAGCKSQHRMNRKPNKRSESLHGVN